MQMLVKPIPNCIDTRLKLYWFLMHNETERIEARIYSVMNQKPIENEDYLMIRLTAASNGIINCDIHTMFVGFSDDSSKYEIREPSIIDPEITKNSLIKVGQPPLIVNSLEDLILFRLFGGNGIIRKKLVEEHWVKIYEKSPCVYAGYEPGFVDIKSIPPSKFAKRPNKTLKKKIKARDANKCMLCNSNDNLTLHHILRRERGGRTDMKNIITLCKVCHAKLHKDPKNPYDDDLYELIGVNKYSKEANKQYCKDVKHYQRQMIDALITIQDNN